MESLGDPGGSQSHPRPGSENCTPGLSGPVVTGAEIGLVRSHFGRSSGASQSALAEHRRAACSVRCAPGGSGSGGNGVAQSCIAHLAGASSVASLVGALLTER